MSIESEKRILVTMRRAAWQRAVGELEAMLETYWGSDQHEAENFGKVSKLVEEFKEKVEEEI